MLVFVCAVVVVVGTLIWTAQSLADAARLPGLAPATRVTWFAALLAGPVLGVGAEAVLPRPLARLVALVPFGWCFLAPWAFLLLTRGPRLGLGVADFRSAWRETATAARWAWLWHGALILVLAVGSVWCVPPLERAFKDFGGAMPGPTQLLIDLSHDLRGRWLLAPLWIALAYALYRVGGALLRLGRASPAPSAAYATLTNAALVVAIVFFTVAMALPAFSMYAGLRQMGRSPSARAAYHLRAACERGGAEACRALRCVEEPAQPEGTVEDVVR